MRRYCQQCEQPIYQNPKPCAGVLVIDDCERVLLIKRTEPPAPGAWSVPAGYLEADEPPSHAAVRELHEETNITLSEDGLQLLDTIFVRHPVDNMCSSSSILRYVQPLQGESFLDRTLPMLSFGVFRNYGEVRRK
jgi:ADP-ribose pyrophosphatase YjhB (NUDIX family)